MNGGSRGVGGGGGKFGRKRKGDKWNENVNTEVIWKSGRKENGETDSLFSFQGCGRSLFVFD